jgi:hypothetical protein
MRPGDPHCDDLEDDPGETRKLRSGPLADEMTERLRIALRAVEAPAEQFTRLGLTRPRDSREHP